MTVAGSKRVLEGLQSRRNIVSLRRLSTPRVSKPGIKPVVPNPES